MINLNIISKIFNFSKKQFSIIIILNIVVMFLELISIGAILPLINSFFEQSSSFDLSKYGNIHLSFKDILILFIIIIALKNIIISVHLYLINKLIYSYRDYLCNKIFINLFNKKYSFFKMNKNSEIFQSINDDSNIFSINVTKPILFILSDILVLFSIVFLMFFINMKITLFIFIFLTGIVVTYYLFFGNYLTKIGIKRRFTDERKINFLNNAINSIKEIKIFNNQNIFINQYSEFMKENSRVLVIANWFQGVPRIILEMIIICFISLTILMLVDSENKTSFISIIAFFSYAALKIIPILNRLTVNFQSLKFGKIYIQKVFNNLKDENFNQENNSEKDIILNKKIEILNLNIKFKEKIIINNLSHIFKAKEFNGVFGESGSGKSILLDSIAGLIKPNNGKILIDGVDINNNLKSYQKLIGYAHQNVYFINDTIENNIIFGRTKLSNHDEQIKNILQITGLDNIVEHLNNKLDYIIDDQSSNLSAGQKQRLGLCRALYLEPPIVILDEATNAIDKISEMKIYQNLKRHLKETTFIIVTHNKDIKELCQNNFVFEKI